MTREEAIKLEENIQKTIASHMKEHEDNVFVSLSLSNLFKIQIVNDGEYLFNREYLQLVCFKSYNSYTYLSTLELTKRQLEEVLYENKKQIHKLLDSYDNRIHLTD
jgi:hypothetical protein